MSLSVKLIDRVLPAQGQRTTGGAHDGRCTEHPMVCCSIQLLVGMGTNMLTRCAM